MDLWPEHTYSEKDFNPITQEQADGEPNEQLPGYALPLLLSYYAPGR